MHADLQICNRPTLQVFLFVAQSYFCDTVNTRSETLLISANFELFLFPFTHHSHSIFNIMLNNSNGYSLAFSAHKCNLLKPSLKTRCYIFTPTIFSVLQLYTELLPNCRVIISYAHTVVDICNICHGETSRFLETLLAEQNTLFYLQAQF